MKVHVTDLKLGDCLTTDTFNRVGLHILPRGTSLQKEEIALLIRHSIDYVDIERSGGSEHPAFFKVEGNLQAVLDLAVQGYESIFLESLTQGKFTASMVNDTLQPLLESLEGQKDVVTLLLMLERDNVDAYNHSLQVGLLSYYLAGWLGHSKKEQYEISKAGYLHDIGKSQLPASILDKEGELTAEEQEEMRRHPEYGYGIIRRSLNDEITAKVALQHHEFGDGSGYPRGCGRSEIHPYTEIVSVANVFIGLSTSNSQRQKSSYLSVLRQVRDMSFGQLNGNAVQALINHLMPNFIGKSVQLSNGETGTIIMNNPLDIFKPLVKVETSFRDLSKERDLVIEEMYI